MRYDRRVAAAKYGDCPLAALSRLAISTSLYKQKSLRKFPSQGSCLTACTTLLIRPLELHLEWPKPRHHFLYLLQLKIARLTNILASLTLYEL